MLIYQLHLLACTARVGLMHIGVFILLLLSGERNFGVRLNKPYTATVPMDIPVFTGSHADLLVTVFHKIIATGHQRLQPLFDCLLTILVNVSPYLKTLSMVASIKLLHLLEAFSTPWFLFSAPANHHLVFFLLEIFNNIIQYQFDGNSNLVYTIIRKRHVFHALANLPSDMNGISRCISTRKGQGRSNRISPVVAAQLEATRLTDDGLSQASSSSSSGPVSKTIPEEDDSEEDANRNGSLGAFEDSMEGSTPAQPAEPGTLKATLLETPALGQMTERESAHPAGGNSAAATPTFEGGIAPTVVDSQTTSVAESTAAAKSSTSSPEASPFKRSVAQRGSIRVTPTSGLPLGNATTTEWVPTSDWVQSWRAKLPLQTIMRLLQVSLVNWDLHTYIHIHQSISLESRYCNYIYSLIWFQSR